MNNQIIRIKLKAFDHRILDQSVKEILHTVRKTGAKVNVIPLPRKIKRFTVIRGPHVHKTSREQYELRTHLRLMVIYPAPQTVDSLMKLQLSSGVDIEIKLLEEGEVWYVN